ncbi:hypothetical protein GCM10009841_11240 [Microlunatus panaciterrae]|uniref:Carboxypeptidase regulatory-like domain-containing protein n=1 Tax=Microlunatus panaciterrae TaxID=400768 RepID=A0ABS2RNB6_9ACTN|nr:hypothetical protein [Microlunatus panaciterrae]MBM7799681.1 hypothetical protein [Microlunatus panaciterrae]
MNASQEDREIELSLQPLDADDQAVLNALRAFYDETDPVPESLVEKIQFELTLDALHTEVANLIQMESVGTAVRGSATEAVRTVTFTSESLTTMVTITPQPDGTVRVDGWASPGAGLTVQVLLAHDTVETVADEDGRFALEGLPAGLAKFALRVPKGEESSMVISPTIEL